MIGPKSGTIEFRAGQHAKIQANDDTVKVFAPFWFKNALEKLLPEFQYAPFNLGDRSEKVLTVTKSNLYRNIKPEAIIALRDLAKRCVIVGKELAHSYGGYPAGKALHPLIRQVYICDLPGLQFQQLNNTGLTKIKLNNKSSN